MKQLQIASITGLSFLTIMILLDENNYCDKQRYSQCIIPECIQLYNIMMPCANQLQKQLRELQQKEALWKEERQQLLKTISLLQQQLSKQKTINNSFLKRNHHKRTSSEQKTFIFNQTNISSYFPIVLLKNNNLNHRATLRSHLDSVRSLKFVQNKLITGGEDATLKIWHNDTLQATLRDHLGPIYTLTATENHLFTAGAQGVVRKWKKQELFQGLPPSFEGDFHQQPIWSMAYNKIKDFLLTSSADQSFKLFKNTDKALSLMWTKRLKKQTPTVVEWMAENRFISGYKNESKLGVFQITEGDLSWQYAFQSRGQYGQANCLQFGNSVKMIAAGHQDHFIRFYDPNSNKSIKEIAAHSDSVTGLQFSAKSFELMSCGQDGNLRVWDLRKYKCMSDMNVHIKKYDQGSLCLSESRQGMVAVGGADGLIKIFTRGNE